ncbi:DUF6054 family protein [Bacillus infantis]|uniref:DUF6054 family protein n=1 Tax=Bacillus infantis TaxID=324767 RepID=UPI003CF30B92
MNHLSDLKTSITPFECAMKLLESEPLNTDKIHEEYHTPAEGIEFCVLVFERFYFRTGGRASLTVIMENVRGDNKVRCISAGSAESLISFDWGAGKSFVNKVKEILDPYTLGK